MMQRTSYTFLLALAAITDGVDAFKFMSNWQPPKVLTDTQKVELAKTEKRFGDKSESTNFVFPMESFFWSPILRIYHAVQKLQSW
jgi:hypothetical protein